MRVNVDETTHFRVLSDDQIKGIVRAAMGILERVGVQVNDEEMVMLLKKGGARSHPSAWG